MFCALISYLLLFLAFVFLLSTFVLVCVAVLLNDVSLSNLLLQFFRSEKEKKYRSKELQSISE